MSCPSTTSSDGLFTDREPGPTPDGGTSEVPLQEARYDVVLQRAG